MAIRALWALALVLALLAAVPLAVAQDAPVENPTNSYYTPKPTFTPITTNPVAQGGKQTTASGNGPSAAPGPYTFNYTQPGNTVSPTQNPGLTSSLRAAGIAVGDDASKLQPDPTNVQVNTKELPDQAASIRANGAFVSVNVAESAWPAITAMVLCALGVLVL